MADNAFGDNILDIDFRPVDINRSNVSIDLSFKQVPGLTFNLTRRYVQLFYNVHLIYIY